MLSNDDDGFKLGDVKEVHNHNRGPGTFYQVNGIQNVYTCPHSVPSLFIDEEGATSEGSDDGHPTNTGPNHGRELEPYQTIIDSLSRICQQVLSFSEHFPSNSTISGVCHEADDLVPLVQCVARTIRQIGQVSPMFISHSIFSSIQLRAFKYTAWLKQLAKSLDEFKPRQHSPRARRQPGNITCGWPSLSQRLQKYFRVCRVAMRKFLRDLTSSHFLDILDIKDGLAKLITYLPPTWGVHHPSVDTIWVREPTGMEWYSIPLRFCKTWTDFAIVIYQYCRNGPEIEYIRQGSWAIIHAADNEIIDKTNFSSNLKPEMYFDIGIIVQLLSAMLRSQCPQCGHYNGESTPMNGWIRCSSLECDNLFRMVFNSSPKIPKIKTILRSASTNGECCIGTSTQAPLLSNEATRADSAGIPSETSTPSLSTTRHRSSLLQEEPVRSDDLLGREHPGLSHLNTNFHRILANVPHSPPEDTKAPMFPQSSEDLPPLSNEGSAPSLDSRTGESKNPRPTGPLSLSDQGSGPSPDSQTGESKNTSPTKDVLHTTNMKLRDLVGNNVTGGEGYPHSSTGVLRAAGDVPYGKMELEHSSSGVSSGSSSSSNFDLPSLLNDKGLMTSPDSQTIATKSPVPTNDILQKPSGAEVVRRLAKSNNETFVCLKVFCEKYREKKYFGVYHLHRHEKKIYKHVVEQAGIYVGTIDTSLGIAEKGIAICKDVKAILDDPKLELVLMVDFMLEKAKEVLDDVTSISARFREIRVALYDEMQRIAPGSELRQLEQGSYTGEHGIELQELKRMDEEDLLQLTVAVLDRFALIVGDFIDWWSDLRTDVGSLTRGIEFIRKNPAIIPRVWKQWNDVQMQYKDYNSEIMAQQDYYHKTLTDLVVPVGRVHRAVHRVAHKLGLE